RWSRPRRRDHRPTANPVHSRPKSMTPEQDHYAVLGLGPDATAAQVSHAYRTLLRRHHPDTRTEELGAGTSGAGHDVALQRVLTAYAVLHDPRRRGAYDQRRGLQSPRRAT